jgi:ion channel POLLUX/CASTOR
MQTLKSQQLRLRYFFDNSLSRRGAFFMWVSLAVLVAAIAIALIGLILKAIPPLNVEIVPGSNAFENFWLSLGKMLSLGTAVSWADRVMAIIYWFAGLTIMGSIFAFRAAALTRTMERLKAAPSPILDSGHTLILGWSPRIFTILKELAIANQNVRKPLVVIFANVDRAVMDSEIALRAPELGKLRVITRKGDTTNPLDLKRANVRAAKSVIVLDSDRGGDSMIVSTVLAARSISDNPTQRFVAEVDDANTAEAISAATGGRVIPVIPRDVISKVTAQASRQPGIPAVILELLDFAGDEIYFTEIPALVGKTFFEAQLSFTNASVIGIKQVAKSPTLNPAHDYKIKKGDSIIAIAQDDDSVTYAGVAEKPKRPTASSKDRATARARNLLVIGWSDMGQRVLTELSGFLPKGSSVDVVSQHRFIEESLGKEKKFGSLSVKHHDSSGEFEQLRQMVAKKTYDEVLVLGYRGENITESEADGQTLLATMQLTRLFDKELSKGTAPRLVAEILDPLKVQLASTSSIDDLVVSENLAALLIAQLSENPELASIFGDLFDPSKGSAVHVRPIGDYAAVGKPVSFAKLIAAASAFGETAIGIRVRGEKGSQREVVINPAKDAEILPFPEDGLIVIGKSI